MHDYDEQREKERKRQTFSSRFFVFPFVFPLTSRSRFPDSLQHPAAHDFFFSRGSSRRTKQEQKLMTMTLQQKENHRNHCTLASFSLSLSCSPANRHDISVHSLKRGRKTRPGNGREREAERLLHTHAHTLSTSHAEQASSSLSFPFLSSSLLLFPLSVTGSPWMPFDSQSRLVMTVNKWPYIAIHSFSRLKRSRRCMAAHAVARLHRLHGTVPCLAPACIPGSVDA